MGHFLVKSIWKTSKKPGTKRRGERPFWGTIRTLPPDPRSGLPGGEGVGSGPPLRSWRGGGGSRPPHPEPKHRSYLKPARAPLKPARASHRCQCSTNFWHIQFAARWCGLNNPQQLLPLRPPLSWMSGAPLQNKKHAVDKNCVQNGEKMERFILLNVPRKSHWV